MSFLPNRTRVYRYARGRIRAHRTPILDFRGKSIGSPNIAYRKPLSKKKLMPLVLPRSGLTKEGRFLCKHES
uniref:Uncharacterized protein n=1 Tax=Utricularia reniformis TaxID=192314 RepID=A0A1Y0AYZ3_9LAMI|nr:hypothetical protein AEK19_MT1302 [Utricularia reniformis]ART30368.1 hypothetical protein AEK19_MT1302 [Utricularia reniformis]